MTSSCSSEKYHSEALELTTAIYEFLPTIGACDSTTDCERKEYVFFEAGDAVRVNIYGITEAANISALNEVIKRTAQHRPSIPYIVTYFKNKKQSEDNEAISEFKTGRTQ